MSARFSFEENCFFGDARLVADLRLVAVLSMLPATQWLMPLNAVSAAAFHDAEMSTVISGV